MLMVYYSCTVLCLKPNESSQALHILMAYSVQDLARQTLMLLWRGFPVMLTTMDSGVVTSVWLSTDTADLQSLQQAALSCQRPAAALTGRSAADDATGNPATVRPGIHPKPDAAHHCQCHSL